MQELPSTKTPQAKTQHLQQQNKDLRADNRKLKQQTKELTRGRDDWKAKCYAARNALNRLRRPPCTLTAPNPTTS